MADPFYAEGTLRCSTGKTQWMDLATLGLRIGARCRLDGEFTLRSGQTSELYFDKYLFEADPELLQAVADHAAALIPPDTEVLAGLELGGVPVAAALSMRTGLPAAFVRKAAKPYGTMKLAEGADVRGRRVLIVEDVVTTGGQVLIAAAALRELGGQVETLFCVIDRSDTHRDLAAADIEVRSLFRSADLGS